MGSGFGWVGCVIQDWVRDRFWAWVWDKALGLSLGLGSGMGFPLSALVGIRFWV